VKESERVSLLECVESGSESVYLFLLGKSGSVGRARWVLIDEIQLDLDDSLFLVTRFNLRWGSHFDVDNWQRSQHLIELVVYAYKNHSLKDLGERRKS